MKRSIWSTAAISALLIAVPLTTANAGNMVLKAPPPPPVPVSSWTGCYIGANAGGALTKMDFNRVGLANGVLAPSDYGSQNDSGVIGGAQAGCDYQIDSQWVVGIKGQFDFANFSGKDALPSFPAFYLTDNTRDIGMATGRIGYIAAPNWLLYAQGGGAWVRDRLGVYSDGPPVTLVESATPNRYGYAAGGGVEYLICPNWSVFAEYNYLGFGTKNVTFAPTLAGGVGDVVAVKQDVQTAFLGVNWRFNWTGALASRY
jgi:outer membrane immunogenic protein